MISLHSQKIDFFSSKPNSPPLLPHNLYFCADFFPSFVMPIPEFLWKADIFYKEFIRNSIIYLENCHEGLLPFPERIFSGFPFVCQLKSPRSCQSHGTPGHTFHSSQHPAGKRRTSWGCLGLFSPAGGHSPSCSSSFLECTWILSLPSQALVAQPSPHFCVQSLSNQRDPSFVPLLMG